MGQDWRNRPPLLGYPGCDHCHHRRFRAEDGQYLAKVRHPSRGQIARRQGPGLSLIIPVIDHIVAVIDERIQTTAFSAEAALTKDTVPVNVDAIIFWFVNDAQKAALNITNYRETIDRVSQTSLREMIGSSMLSALLSERTTADELLRMRSGAKPPTGASR